MQHIWVYMAICSHIYIYAAVYKYFKYIYMHLYLYMCMFIYATILLYIHIYTNMGMYWLAFASRFTLTMLRYLCLVTTGHTTHLYWITLL